MVASTSCRLVILKSVIECESYLAGETLLGDKLASAHQAVADFLDASGLDYIELSDLATYQDVRSFWQTADIVVESALAALDAESAGSIASELGLPRDLRVWAPIYRYHLKYEYVLHRLLTQALRSLIDAEEVDHVAHYAENRHADVGFLLSRKFFEFAVEDRVQVTTLSLSPQKKSLKNRIQLGWKHRDFNWFKLGQRLRRAVNWNARAGSSMSPARRKQILFLGEPYELSGLQQLVPDLHVCSLTRPYHKYSEGDKIWEALEKAKQQINILASKDLKIDVEGLGRYFLYGTIEHLKGCAEEKLVSATWVAEHREDFSAAVWGCPPCGSAAALSVEYLLTVGCTVVGMQHGGVYCVQNCMSKHFDTDFSRCSVFLSFGFTREDLRETYPNREPQCQIVATGSYREWSWNCKKPFVSNPAKRLVDVMFPITYGMSLAGGTLQTSCGDLTRYQREILDFLELRRDIRSVVKPPPLFNESMFGHTMRVMKMKRARVSCLPFREALKRFNPRVVILEHASTPLLECLTSDSEILIIDDPMLPFPPKVRASLEMRAHIFLDATTLLRALDQFFSGELEKRRSREFYDHHVFRADTPSIIAAEINKAAGL